MPNRRANPPERDEELAGRFGVHSVWLLWPNDRSGKPVLSLLPKEVLVQRLGTLSRSFDVSLRQSVTVRNL